MDIDIAESVIDPAGYPGYLIDDEGVFGRRRTGEVLHETETDRGKSGDGHNAGIEPRQIPYRVGIDVDQNRVIETI